MKLLNLSGFLFANFLIRNVIQLKCFQMICTLTLICYIQEEISIRIDVFQFLKSFVIKIGKLHQ